MSDRDDPPIAVGEIRFYDSFEPPLDAGDYVISVSQTISDAASGLAQDIPAGGPLTQNFSIVGPRFALDPADVHSVFPPAGGLGIYDQYLPHVVLSKRNLPWERYLERGNKATPWLALLLFSADEIIAPQVAPGSPPSPDRAGDYRSSDVIEPPSGIVGPSLVAERQDLLDRVTGLRLIDGGSGYTSAPTVSISGGGGSGAAATATVRDGAVVALTLTAGGSGYSSTPEIQLTGGGGQDAAATAQRGVPVRAIDIDSATFTRVTPRYSIGGSGTDELKYLAHCRQVPTGDKPPLETKDDGWFSVVIANRFPGSGTGPVTAVLLQDGGSGYTTPPTVTVSGGGGAGAIVLATVEEGCVTGLTLAAGGSGYTAPLTVSISGGGGTGAQAAAQVSTPWIAHLVSLEGYENYLTDAPQWPAPTVRLASLHSWTFTCLSQTGDFRDLMTHLTAGQAAGGDGLLLRCPLPATLPAGAAAAAQALGQGYSAFPYATLIGDSSFAWYRGPLAPLPVPRMSVGADSSAGAMIYDPANGLFDQSYAAAFQTGRLLGLADGRFGAALLKWRRQTGRSIGLLLDRVGADAVPAGPGGLRALVAPSARSTGFMNRLLGTFSKEIASRLPDLLPIESTETPATPAAVPNRLAALRAVMARSDIREALAGQVLEAAQDPDDPLTIVTTWLAGLQLLEGVPFLNLVPDERMLPRESLRFFYVDPNYLDALAAGAMSIGIGSSRDREYQAMIGPALDDAVQAAIPRIRARRTGAQAPAPAPAPGPPPSTTMAGLLLRSAVVADWPGLEVRGYATTDSSQPILASRIDRLAPDLLLVLFATPPERIEISEPKEGLAFGHEDDGIIDLRWVSGTAGQLGAIIVGASSTLGPASYRDSSPAPVLDIDALQGQLLAKLTAAYTEAGQAMPSIWGPAAFAIQMVRAPEEFVVVGPQS